MEKYKEIKDIVCPFCGRKPKLVYVSRYFPKFYCEECEMSLSYKITWNSKKYIFDDSGHANYCKKHNAIYEEKCCLCENEKMQKKFSRLRFNKEQLKFLSEYDYEISDMAEKKLGVKNAKS